MKSKILLTILIVSILTGCFVVLGGLLGTRVTKEYTAETGEKVSADVYRAYEWDQAKFEWVSEPDTSLPGSYLYELYVFPVKYEVTLHVIDTIAPIAETQSVCIMHGETVSPEQFILGVTEVSVYTMDFLTYPDTLKYGFQTVSLEIKDSAGNKTEASAQLYVVNLRDSFTINLGDKLPQPEAFLAEGAGEISYLSAPEQVDTSVEHSETLKFLVDGVEATSVLNIVDSEAPVLELTPIELWMNKPAEVEQFVVNVEDNSGQAEVFFAKEPDWSLEGEQQVTVIARDKNGNEVQQDTILKIKRDMKAPIVSVTDIDVQVGGTVAYKKNVSYYDDIDSKNEMKLTVERSAVNLNEVGTYEVIYTVTDCSGNATSVTGHINVLAEAPKWEDEEKIHTKAQEILSSILKEGMTEREKAKAIYSWTKSHIRYIKHSEKGNYLRGAYEGLFLKEGDCFVYAATAKELLTQAGIQNLDIKKSRTNPSHYWNLVYMEDGWYHFDTTPRSGGGEFFLLTDAELDAYSKKHKDTHIYDKSLYPEVK